MFAVTRAVGHNLQQISTWMYIDSDSLDTNSVFGGGQLEAILNDIFSFCVVLIADTLMVRKMLKK